MSVTAKILTLCAFLMVLPFQKEKDKCLIIYLKDNKELYKVGTTRGYKDQFYLYLKYPNPPKDDDEYKNPLIVASVKKYPKGTSYNLQNREEIKALPNSVALCNCAILKKLNLDMEFKLYVEKEDGWVAFDAKKFLVEE